MEYRDLRSTPLLQSLEENWRRLEIGLIIFWIDWR